MNPERSYVCAGCKGKVSVPKGRRLPLDRVREAHEATCPSRRADKA